MPDNEEKVYTKKEMDEVLAKQRTSIIQEIKGSGGLGESLVNAATAPLFDSLDSEKYRIGLNDIKNTLGDLTKNVTSFNISGIFQQFTDGAASVLKNIAEIDAQMRTNLEGQGSAYGDLADGMRKQIGDIGSVVSNIGVTMQDTIEGVKSLTDASGRFALIGKQTITEGLTASAAYTKSNTFLLENTEKFRTVGLGLADAAKSVTSIGQTSISLGLNAKKVTDTLVTNLDKLNTYGFKNGIDGLSRMVQQAQSLGISVDRTFTIASDLFDPAKAIDMTANLQALGGAFGDFADPLKLMYDATNNVDGLQDSLAGAAKNLATYNTEQGRFEVSGANLRRANDVAKTLGISTSELANIAVRAANKFEVMSKLEMFPNLNKDQKEFVSNLATLKDGKVGFDVPDSMAEKIFGTGAKGGFKSLEEVGGHIEEFRKLQQKMAEQKPEEIARSQYNAVTNIMNTVNSIALRMGAQAYNSETSDKMQSAMSDLSTALYNANTRPENKGKTVGEIMKSEAFQKDISASINDFKGASKSMLDEIGKQLGISQSNMTTLEQKVSGVVAKAGEIVKPAISKVETGLSNIGSKASEKVNNFIQNVTGTVNVTHTVDLKGLNDQSILGQIFTSPTANAAIDSRVHADVRDFTTTKK